MKTRLILLLLLFSVFLSQPTFSQTTFIEAIINKVIDGLGSAIPITVSPDGKYIYVGNENDNGIAVFVRDAATGQLTYVEVIKTKETDGSGNLIDGLDSVNSLAVSPDGKHLYAVDHDDHTLLLFTRDANTGKLTYVEMLKDGGTDGSGNPIDGLNRATWITVSPYGKHVYTASDGDNAVAVFSREAATGKLTYVELLKDGGTDGSGNAIDGLDDAYSVTVSPDGKHVYIAGKSDDAVAMFTRDATTGKLTFVEMLKDGGTDGSGNAINGLDGANSVMVSPDGEHVYAASAGDDAVVVFTRDAVTGKLTFVETLLNGATDGSGNVIDGLNEAVFITVSPDGNHVYVAGRSDDAVAVFTRETSTGRLTYVEKLKDGATDGAGNAIDDLNAPRSVMVSPDGKHVYAAAYDDDAATVFTRDGSTGKLTYVETLKDNGFDGSGTMWNGLDYANSVTVSPDGKYVYAVGLDDDAVVTFARDATTGKLTHVETLLDGATDGSGNPIAGMDGPRSVTVSSDGKHVYVASNMDDAVAVFTRETNTGKLTFVEVLKDGANDGSGNPIDGLDGAFSVTVSPDGEHVYVASNMDDAVAVFTRDATNGKLTFVEMLKDGATDGLGNAIDGLDGAQSVTVSPDRNHAYATGVWEAAVAVFTRDATTGKLTFVEVLKDGATDGSGNTIDGLNGAGSVTVSPDNKHVYATGQWDHAVVVFTRDATTGKLTFVEVLKDGATDGSGNTIDGLGSAMSVAVSPNGNNVYIAAGDDAFVIFTRDAATGKLSFEEVFKDDAKVGSGNFIDGLESPFSVTVSPNGKNIYLADTRDDGLAVFGSPLGDNDGDGLPNSKELGDRDNDGIPDDADYDPTGWIYLESNGYIVPGGTINVIGPGAVNIIHDGSTGYYQWTVTVPGTYTMSYTLPAGYLFSTICLPQATPYTPTPTPDPNVIGTGSKDGTTDFIKDYACSTNPYYFSFNITPGSPLIINNNIPMQGEQQPTSITLSSFEAAVENTGIVISWTSNTEANCAGYNIHRSLQADEGYVKLNPSLIAAQGNSTTGAGYSYTDNPEQGASFYYKLEDVNLQGESGYHEPVYVSLTSVDKNQNAVPDKYLLSQNYPNPFNPVTTINFGLPKPGLVEIFIYDINGKLVNRLISEQKAAGYHSVRWNAKNKNGSRLTSGIYYYKLTAGDFQQTNKMILMK
jgi:6-phosphogluconolactonase (cycloisomerase 2 family)